MVRPVLRSVLPAAVILALTAAVAVVAAGYERPAPSAPWSPPAGFERAAAVRTADGVQHELWLSASCWYLAVRSPGGEGAWGACGAVPGEPWIVYDGGVVAGQLRPSAFAPTAPLAWVSVNGGEPLALTGGAFLAVAANPGRTATLEFLDRQRRPVNRFEDVFVGGSR